MNLLEVIMHYLSEPDAAKADAWLSEIDVAPEVQKEIKPLRNDCSVQHVVTVNTEEVTGKICEVIPGSISVWTIIISP